MGKSVAWVAIYIAFVVLVNWLFANVAPWPTAWGDVYLANFVVGFIFVIRDYAQRWVGHKILLATLVAGLFTWGMVSAEIAMASVVAFMVSETMDWGVFSFWKRPLQQRILLSSLIAVPLDTFVFQYLAGYLSPASFIMEIASKAGGVMLVWYLLRLRPTPDTVLA